MPELQRRHQGLGDGIEDFKQPTAIIFGTESTGITAFWQNNADHLIKSPMLSKIDPRSA